MLSANSSLLRSKVRAHDCVKVFKLLVGRHFEAPDWFPLSSLQMVRLDDSPRCVGIRPKVKCLLLSIALTRSSSSYSRLGTLSLSWWSRGIPLAPSHHRKSLVHEHLGVMTLHLPQVGPLWPRSRLTVHIRTLGRPGLTRASPLFRSGCLGGIHMGRGHLPEHLATHTTKASIRAKPPRCSHSCYHHLHRRNV